MSNERQRTDPDRKPGEPQFAGSSPASRTKFFWMKKLLFLALAAFLAGCANRYDVTLNNGMRLSGVSKPVLNRDTGEYSFNNASGQTMKIKEGRVREIEPHREARERTQFRTVAPKSPK
jgi:hypothetical protein